ncbi:Uncharacterised protein [Prevotella denticola]|uniref:Uncharacterized protein n=1 Tax=Prevotella denticola TaxID=28129 RepID=A0A379E5B4_9BACT|nr:Uncharacterised protein [Prevotella denticola]
MGKHCRKTLTIHQLSVSVDVSPVIRKHIKVIEGRCFYNPSSRITNSCFCSLSQWLIVDVGDNQCFSLCKRLQKAKRQYCTVSYFARPGREQQVRIRHRQTEGNKTFCPDMDSV